MAYYMNFYFKEIMYDDREIMGLFLSRDDDVSCRFVYNRISEEITIWDNNKPIEEMTPIPIDFLLYKLAKGEVLR